MTDRHSHLQDEFLASSTNETTVNNTNNNPTQQQLPLGKTSVTVPVTGGNSTTNTSGNASTGTGGHLMGIGNNVLLQQPIQQLSQLQSQQGQGQMSQSQSQSLSQQQTQQQGNATNIITSNALSTPHSNASNLQLQQQIHLQQQQLHQQQIQLHNFWQGQINQIRQINPDTTDFKTHQLPLARIKKIMKTDEDVRMISAEAPVLFAKACELFILELSLRSWIHTEENKRRTLQRNDIATAVTKTDMFDFLIDIVPREDLKAAQSMSAAAVTALSFNPMAVGLAGPDGSIIKQEHDGKTEGMSAENANEMANIYQQQLQQQQAALQHMMQQSQTEGGNPQQWQNQQFGQQYQQLQQVIDSQQQHQQQQSQNNGQHSDNSKNNNDASGANEQPTIEV